MTLENVALHLVDSMDEVANLRRWLGERRETDFIAFDIETTGLSHEHDRVRMIQFGDLHHGWAVPRDEWLGAARDAFRLYEGRWVGHNVVSFDCPFLRDDCGIELPPHRVDDTFIRSKVLEPHMSAALKSQATRHVDPVAAGAQRQLDEALGKSGGWTWATVPCDYEPYWSYAALDTVLTAHLEVRHAPLVVAECPKAYDLEVAVSRVVERMERYGAHIDVAYAREKYDAFVRYVEESGAWVERTYGVKAGSNAAIVRVLEEAGFTFTKATAGGATALDKEVIGGIDHPLARTVLQRRQLQKLASTYLRHFIDEVDTSDRIHPSINTLGARTSRMSMSEPNLQNLPRKSETNRAADTIRNSITTRYEGGRLLMCDFAQIEMRLLAHFAREQKMIDAFKAEGDFFVNLARQIFDDPTLEKNDPRRQITKNAGYAKIYGAGVTKFALTAGITQDNARAFLARFDQLYPGVRRFQQEVDKTAWSRWHAEGEAYVRSPLTNRRHVADGGKIYPLVNFVTQGTAAEILKMKILAADAAGLGEWFVVPVHDELILDVPVEHANEAAHMLLKVMNDDTLLTVPITASLSYGDRWGSKTDFVDDVGVV